LSILYPWRSRFAIIVSVTSGIFVALQDKFRYEVIAEQWNGVSAMYAMLASQAYGEMTENELQLEDKSSPTEERELLVDFCRYCIIQERQGSSVPTLPGFILDQVEPEEPGPLFICPRMRPRLNVGDAGAFTIDERLKIMIGGLEISQGLNAPKDLLDIV